MASTNNPLYINAQSMASTITGPSCSLTDLPKYCFQTVYTGCTNAVGTFQIQGSNDNTNWVPITGATVTLSTFTGSDTDLYEIIQASYYYVRLVYTATSGSGTLTVSFRSIT